MPPVKKVKGAPAAVSSATPIAKIRLSDFIRKNSKQIVSEWGNFARMLFSADIDKTPLALNDHIEQILHFVIADIDSPQTHFEQIQKSQGKKKKVAAPSAAETHAAMRLASGYDIDQMVSEYRALRASVIKLWSAANTVMDEQDMLDLTRFNEAIDQELAESISHYTKKILYSKDLFVGILSHELRNPLNVISLSAQLILHMSSGNERQTMLTTQIHENATRISHLIDVLLDVTRAKFGSGLPVVRVPMDMKSVSRQLVAEMQITHAQRKINLSIKGNVEGEWDKTRIVQIFLNLIGNAIPYGFKDSPVDVALKGSSNEVVITVHNAGVPIPSKKLATIFDSLSRAVTDKGDDPSSINLGLGLYITKEIVIAHGGTIDVYSTKKEGTEFTVRLPKTVSV